jgi:hypothetical protein
VRGGGENDESGRKKQRDRKGRSGGDSENDKDGTSGRRVMPETVKRGRHKRQGREQ